MFFLHYMKKILKSIFLFLMYFFYGENCIWDKVNGPSKIYERQPLKKFEGTVK